MDEKTFALPTILYNYCVSKGNAVQVLANLICYSTKEVYKACTGNEMRTNGHDYLKIGQW